MGHIPLIVETTLPQERQVGEERQSPRRDVGSSVSQPDEHGKGLGVEFRKATTLPPNRPFLFPMEGWRFSGKLSNHTLTNILL